MRRVFINYYICNMKSVVITPKNKRELDFVSQLLEKLNISSRELSLEEMEDIGMTQLMHETDRSKKVSREQIMKKLNAR